MIPIYHSRNSSSRRVSHRSGRECWHGIRCNRLDCPFIHPSGRLIDRPSSPSTALDGSDDPSSKPCAPIDPHHPLEPPDHLKSTLPEYLRGVTRLAFHNLNVTQDLTAAEELFIRAASMGHMPACKGLCVLGYRYTNADGVPQDYLKAANIFHLTASMGHREGTKGLRCLAHRFLHHYSKHQRDGDTTTTTTTTTNDVVDDGKPIDDDDDTDDGTDDGDTGDGDKTSNPPRGEKPSAGAGDPDSIIMMDPDPSYAAQMASKLIYNAAAFGNDKAKHELVRFGDKLLDGGHIAAATPLIDLAASLGVEEGVAAAKLSMYYILSKEQRDQLQGVSMDQECGAEAEQCASTGVAETPRSLAYKELMSAISEAVLSVNQRELKSAPPTSRQAPAFPTPRHNVHTYHDDLDDDDDDDDVDDDVHVEHNDDDDDDDDDDESGAERILDDERDQLDLSMDEFSLDFLSFKGGDYIDHQGSALKKNRSRKSSTGTSSSSSSPTTSTTNTRVVKWMGINGYHHQDQKNAASPIGTSAPSSSLSSVATAGVSPSKNGYHLNSSSVMGGT